MVIGLPQMLSKERDGIVACLVVVGKQMHTKLVVDVLCDSLSLVVLLGCFVAMRVLLDALRDRGGPIFDRSHAPLSGKSKCSLVNQRRLSRCQGQVLSQMR